MFRYMLLFLFVPDVHLFFLPPFRMPKAVNFLEELFIHNYYSNCTQFDIFTKMNSTQLAQSVAQNLHKISLVHYVGNERIIHNISNAHITIPASPKFNISKPIAMFAHGWMATNAYPLAMPFINNLKNKGIVNMFVFEHVELTADPNYYNSSANTRIAGEALGDALTKLYAAGVKNVHCIGISLGAHSCGFGGKKFKQNTGQLMDRITGLDPAGPCYFYESPEFRLDSGDAKFVDIMHTDSNALGIAKSIGHVDFFPNGGENMLGCVVPFCGHAISPLYFDESVTTQDFLAVKCSDWETFKNGSCANNDRQVMGYWTAPTARGDYYLFLNAIPKYSLGEEGIAKPGFNWRKFL